MTVSLISDHIAQPHIVRFKGFGMLPNKLKTAIPGLAGNRCFAVCGAPHALLAKAKKLKYKSSDENAVGILEKGFFHDMEEMDYFSLEQSNRNLCQHLDALNSALSSKKPHNLQKRNSPLRRSSSCVRSFFSF